MIGPEYSGMHNMQREFVIRGTFKAVGETFKVQHFNKTGNTNNMESDSGGCSSDKVKKQSHEQRQWKRRSFSLAWVDAHQNHTSSSDSCSRSALFRSPTSEVQTFLSLDLTNLGKKKIISGYMIPRFKTLEWHADYSYNKQRQSPKWNGFYLTLRYMRMCIDYSNVYINREGASLECIMGLLSFAQLIIYKTSRRLWLWQLWHWWNIYFKPTTTYGLQRDSIFCNEVHNFSLGWQTKWRHMSNLDWISLHEKFLQLVCILIFYFLSSFLQFSSGLFYSYLMSFLALWIPHKSVTRTSLTSSHLLP